MVKNSKWYVEKRSDQYLTVFEIWQLVTVIVTMRGRFPRTVVERDVYVASGKEAARNKEEFHVNRREQGHCPSVE